MAWARAALVTVVALVVAAALVSGGERDDSVLGTLAAPGAIGAAPSWLARARPLGEEAPPWAQRLYRRSLLVLRALTDRSGAVVAGARDGWEYVWPRDAGVVAMAFAAAGYRGEARRVARFLLGLDLDTAARFRPDGSPVDGRATQGDATGWVGAAARAAGLPAPTMSSAWRNRTDYQEGRAGDYLGNALAWAAAGPKGTSAGDLSARRRRARAIRKEFVRGGILIREAEDSGAGIDSSAAWAVRPFEQPALRPIARRSLLRLATRSGRYGLVPSQDWDGGVDPWTAPTAWIAWSLAALGERRAALHLMAAVRRAATRDDLLPERVDARTGTPTSTTPLAWSHAFAILALRELWP